MELKLPELSERSEGSIITLWHVKENEKVVAGQDILEVATDKATFDIPAPCDGVLVRVIKQTGEKAKTGDILAEIVKIEECV